MDAFAMLRVQYLKTAVKNLVKLIDPANVIFGLCAASNRMNIGHEFDEIEVNPTQLFEWITVESKIRRLPYLIV